MNDLSSQVLEVVLRMATARNRGTRTYMPAALLAATDLAARGRIVDAVVLARDLYQRFEEIMIEVWPTREDLGWRPFLHCHRHAMWQVMLGDEAKTYTPRRISRLQTQKQALRLADRARLTPVLAEALSDAGLRDLTRQHVYQVLRSDDDPRSALLADLHESRWLEERHEFDAELLSSSKPVVTKRDLEDARKQRMASITIREGQNAFRARLLLAYGSRCAMSGSDAPQALTAAHIYPYLGPHTNHVSNGLLLRADIHLLFDRGLVCVAGKQLCVHRQLRGTVYARMQGRQLASPTHPGDAPNPDALAWHYRRSLDWLSGG